MIQIIKNQLQHMNIHFDEVTNIRSKDGVHLYRIKSSNNSFVLKYFENIEFRREIKNYLILQSLEILTIPLIAYSDEAVLMEDINVNKDIRLAVKEDMNDANIAYSLGKWYKNLHEKGKSYIRKNGDGMYMESDCITLPNIYMIKQKTNTANNSAWQVLEDNFDLLQKIIDNTEKTLIYNDYYYTNMAISNEHGAFMFDYNLLGKGYVSSDIKNVTVQLGEEAKEAFLESYGGYNEQEMFLHEVVGTIVGLCFACQREVFPKWAHEDLEAVHNGKLLKDLKALL